MPSNTTIKGEVACLHFEMRAHEKGAIISRPTIECGYDRVVDWKGKIYRVQVKYAGGRSSYAAGVAVAQLRRSDRNKQQRYTGDEIDAIVCYLPQVGRICWLPAKVWEGKAAISIRYEPAKNNQHNGCFLADDYEW